MFIRVQELEWILLHFNELRTLLEELELELQVVQSEKAGGDDEIYSRTMRRNTDGMPFSTHMVSDRTAIAVINKSNVKRELRAAIKEVQGDILLVDLILKKVEIALHALRSTERRIVELRFFERLTWSEVATEVRYEKRSVQQKSKAAVERMTAIARITLVDQQKIKILLEGE